MAVRRGEEGAVKLEKDVSTGPDYRGPPTPQTFYHPPSNPPGRQGRAAGGCACSPGPTRAPCRRPRGAPAARCTWPPPSSSTPPSQKPLCPPLTRTSPPVLFPRVTVLRTPSLKTGQGTRRACARPPPGPEVAGTSRSPSSAASATRVGRKLRDKFPRSPCPHLLQAAPAKHNSHVFRNMRRGQ